MQYKLSLSQVNPSSGHCAKSACWVGGHCRDLPGHVLVNQLYLHLLLLITSDFLLCTSSQLVQYYFMYKGTVYKLLTIVPATVGSDEKSISLLPHNCMEKESLTTPSLTN